MVLIFATGRLVRYNGWHGRQTANRKEGSLCDTARTIVNYNYLTQRRSRVGHRSTVPNHFSFGKP